MVKNKRFYQITFLFFILTLAQCADNTLSISDMSGFDDPNYLKVVFVPGSNNKTQPFLEIYFKKPPTIPEGSNGNELVISFVIEKSPSYPSNQPYYEKISVYLIFNIISSGSKESLKLNGVVYNHCASPCSSVINSAKDVQGNSLFNFDKNEPTLFHIKPLVLEKSQPKEEQQFMVKVGIDPLRLNESWIVRQGYPGQHLNFHMLLLPFYKQNIKIKG